MSILKMGLGAIAASALVLSAANPVAAAPAVKSDTAQLHGGSGMTDISAQRRYRGGGGGAAAAAAFAGIVGTAIAVGAARSAYDDGYYEGGPAYGYSSPYDAYNSYGGPVYGGYGGDYSRDRSGAVFGSGYRRPENNPSR